ALPLEQVQDLGGLAPLANASRWLRLFGGFACFGALLGGGGLLARLALGGRDTGLLCPSVGLLGCFRLLGGAGYLFVLLRFCDLGAHFRSFSFRGFGRDQDIHHSAAGHLQVNPARFWWESFEGQEASAGVAGAGVEVTARG